MEYWRNPFVFVSFPLLESPSKKNWCWPSVDWLGKSCLIMVGNMNVHMIYRWNQSLCWFNSSICVRQIPFYRHMLISIPILWWIHTWIHHIVCIGAQLQCDPHESCCMQESMVFPIRIVFLRKSKFLFCFWVVWLEFKFPTEMFGITLLTKQHRLEIFSHSTCSRFQGPKGPAMIQSMIMSGLNKTWSSEKQGVANQSGAYIL